MAKGKSENGSSPKGVQNAPKVRMLTSKRFRRDSIDHFAEDFCSIHEVGADDVAHNRLDPSIWNSMRGSYSNMLRMIDVQIRVRRMGIVPIKKRLLK